METKDEFIIEEEFVLSEYFEKMEIIIKNILLRPENDVLTYDILDTEKSNLDKLSKFKKENPEYTCIYANINADTEKKTLQGINKKISHNGVEIEHQVGYQFLKFIFGKKTEEIIEFVKNTIDKYT